MVSSGGGGGGGGSSMRGAAAPPGNILEPVGSYNPQYVNFLPSGGAPATGLTPEMEASIMAPPAPRAAAPTGPSPDALKAMLSQMMAQRGYGQAMQRASNESNAGAFGGGGGPGIQSFSTLRSIMNPAYTPQQRANLARTVSMNNSSRGGDRSSRGGR